MASTTSSGTITASLPLTTTFTPPSACLTDLWAAEVKSVTWMNLGPADTAVCLPSGWSPSQTFTPGVCPSGWHVASNITTRVSNEAVTIGTCCPQYSLSNWIFSTRPSTDPPAVLDELYTTEICQWSPTTPVDYIYTYLDDGVTESRTGSMTSGGVWNAYGVVVAWQSNDQTPTTTTAMTTAVTTSLLKTYPTTRPPTSSPTSSPNSMSPATHSSSGLSSGAKAGIGVGVALGAILILSALGLLIWRRRKPELTQESPAEVKLRPNSEIPSTDRAWEAHSNHIQEAQSVHVPVELEGTTR